MSDKDREQTPEEKIAAIYAKIPEEQAQQLIQAAANISGKPAAALQILKDKTVADRAAAIIWENMSMGQLERLLTAEETGEIEPALLSIVWEIAQIAQENTAERDKIIIDISGYDPKTDPASPEFDLEAWKAAIAAEGGYEAIRERINSRFETALKPIAEALTSNIVETAKTALSGITAFINEAMTLNQEQQEELSLVHGIRLKSHTMSNNALMNTLQQKKAINAGPFDMVVANAKGRRKEITVYTMIELDPGETGIKITDASLSEYERQVSDAIISLWIEAIGENLPPIFTPDMIFRAMPGGSDTLSPQQKGAITKTIEKFRHLYINLDATEEMRTRGIIGSNDTFKINDPYLSATIAEHKVKNGRQTVNAYRINAEPIMLTYCKLTKQLLTVAAKHLAIKKVKKDAATKKLYVSNELVTMTAARQAMTGYMLRRIAVMKHDRKNKVQTQSNVILFDTLFSETGTKTDNRKQTMNNRNFCFKVLDYWKASGFIKDYKKQEKGRSITGIVIIS